MKNGNQANTNFDKTEDYWYYFKLAVSMFEINKIVFKNLASAGYTYSFADATYFCLD